MIHGTCSSFTQGANTRRCKNRSPFPSLHCGWGPTQLLFLKASTQASGHATRLSPSKWDCQEAPPAREPLQNVVLARHEWLITWEGRPTGVSGGQATLADLFSPSIC